jgi:hypothetical protein
MGIEQSVVSTGFDLLHNLDLPDPRLPRAFKAWIHFKATHAPQISTINSLPLNDMLILTRELSTSIAHAIGLSGPLHNLGAISTEKTENLA